MLFAIGIHRPPRQTLRHAWHTPRHATACPTAYHGRARNATPSLDRSGKGGIRGDHNARNASPAISPGRSDDGRASLSVPTRVFCGGLRLRNYSFVFAPCEWDQIRVGSEGIYSARSATGYALDRPNNGVVSSELAAN